MYHQEEDARMQDGEVVGGGRESQVLKRDIRNLWHCESNQSIFIMMSAIASNMKMYESEI